MWNLINCKISNMYSNSSIDRIKKCIFHFWFRRDAIATALFIIHIHISLFIEKKKRLWKYNSDESDNKVIILWLPVSWIILWINHDDVRIYAPSPTRPEKPFSFADKKEGRKTGWKQHLRGTPVFFNLLCIHLPSSRLNTLFFLKSLSFSSEIPDAISRWIC